MIDLLHVWESNVQSAVASKNCKRITSTLLHDNTLKCTPT